MLNLFLKEDATPLTPLDIIGEKPDIDDDEEVQGALVNAHIFAVQWNAREKLRTQINGR